MLNGSLLIGGLLVFSVAQADSRADSVIIARSFTAF